MLDKVIYQKLYTNISQDFIKYLFGFQALSQVINKLFISSVVKKKRVINM